MQHLQQYHHRAGGADDHRRTIISVAPAADVKPARLEPEMFYKAVWDQGIRFFTGVPDSRLKGGGCLFLWFTPSILSMLRIFFFILLANLFIPYSSSYLFLENITFTRNLYLIKNQSLTKQHLFLYPSRLLRICDQQLGLPGSRDHL